MVFGNLTKETSKIKKDIKDEKKKIAKDIDELGEYLLFGSTLLILVAVPFVYFISSKVPEVIDQAAKIADIVKPI